ncbi:MAG TPA: ABC transporter permease [Nocardioidaceae bacterium]|nr:ABC transporter permease [Nocardioidaceae bacterium]
MSSLSESGPAGRPAGVIHDIGYRPYSGPRHGEGPVAWSLFRTGLRNCYGLGRSGKSKVLPMVLLGLMLLPALILVGVLVQAKDALGLDAQIVSYSAYPITTQLLISVFVASQAPALISRDLRFRTITLYLARPLRRDTYVLVRMASLATATFVLIAAPLLLLYLGGVLADLPAWRETKSFAVALVGALLLAAVLAGLAALVSAVTTRRGLAVAAVIVVLLVSYTVASAVQGIATEVGRDGVAEAGGLLSPYTLIDGLQHWLFDSPASSPAPPTSTGMGLAFLAVTLATIVGTVVAMLLRYRKTAAA